MMATEISRTFDVAGGKVVLEIQDALGNKSVHSIYVSGPSAVKDVPAAITSVMADTDSNCADLQKALESAGWKAAPDGN